MAVDFCILSGQSSVYMLHSLVNKENCFGKDLGRIELDRKTELNGIRGPSIHVVFLLINE